MKVGVAYGSPAKKVQSLLLQTAKEHKDIFHNDHQKPLAFFSDFGANALEFTLTFWILVERPLDIKRTTSDIRFQINELFQKKKSLLPFLKETFI